MAASEVEDILTKAAAKLDKKRPADSPPMGEPSSKRRKFVATDSQPATIALSDDGDSYDDSPQGGAPKPSASKPGESSGQQKGESKGKESEQGDRQQSQGGQSGKEKSAKESTEETPEATPVEQMMVVFDYIFKDRVVKEAGASSSQPPEVILLDTPPPSPRKEPERSIPISADDPTSVTSKPILTLQTTNLADTLMTETYEDQNPHPDPSKEIHQDDDASLENVFAFLYDRDTIPITAVPINPYLNPSNKSLLSDARRRFINEKSGLNKNANSSLSFDKVLSIEQRKFSRDRVLYHIYIVKTKDNKVETFNDNDLVLLNPYDLLLLHARCRNFADKQKGAATAMREIEFAMQEHVNLRTQVDFQLGIDFEVEKLAIGPPNESLEGLEMHRSGTVVGHPPILICRQKGVKKAIRAAETHKYSTMFLNYLRDVISELPSEKCPEDCRGEYIDQIDLMKSFRALIRNFDRILRGTYY